MSFLRLSDFQIYLNPSNFAFITFSKFINSTKILHDSTLKLVHILKFFTANQA